MATRTGKPVESRSRYLMAHATKMARRCQSAREKELLWKGKRLSYKEQMLKAIGQLTPDDRRLYSEKITKLTCSI